MQSSIEMQSSTEKHHDLDRLATSGSEQQTQNCVKKSLEGQLMHCCGVT